MVNGGIQPAARGWWMDRDLVQRARHGDHDAFEALISVRFDALYTLAQRILRDVDRTDDAVQACLVTAWRKLPQLRDPERFEAWLRRTLVHACYDEARRARRTGAEIRSLPLDRADGRDAGMGVIDRDQLERGFRRLAVEQRVVLVMTHYLGMTAAEIATTLDVPIGTVQSRLRYALASMRAVLEADARPGRPGPAAAGGAGR